MTRSGQPPGAAPLPAGFAAVLPGHYYADPAVHALEQQRVFGEMWVCVGRAGDVAGPGDFACVTVAGESVILVCDGGQLRAFYNVCRHRGARLCTEPKGRAASLRCPYHAWTYGLDGGLIGAPMLSELRAHGMDLSRAALVPVACERWHGMLWLNLAGAGGGVADQVQPALVDRFGDDRLLARYGLADLAVGRTIEYEVAANWKLVVENFMECSHCGPIHPELCRVLPSFRDGLGSFGSGGRGVELAADVESFSLSGRGARAGLPGLAAGEERRVHAAVLLPNVLLLLCPDHVVSLLLTPRAVDRTGVRCDWLFERGEVARHGFDPSDAVELFDRVNRQDWRVLELIQPSTRSRAWSGGFLAPSERSVRPFLDFVLARLGGGGRP